MAIFLPLAVNIYLLQPNIDCVPKNIFNSNKYEIDSNKYFFYLSNYSVDFILFCRNIVNIYLLQLYIDYAQENIYVDSSK